MVGYFERQFDEEYDRIKCLCFIAIKWQRKEIFYSIIFPGMKLIVVNSYFILKYVSPQVKLRTFKSLDINSMNTFTFDPSKASYSSVM